MPENTPCPCCVAAEAFAVIAAARAAMATLPPHPAMPVITDLLHTAQDGLALLLVDEERAA